MLKIFKIPFFYLKLIGINLPIFFRCIFEFPLFLKSYFKILFLSKKYKDFKIGIPFPILYDKKENGGSAKGHYFHQDLYVAKKIYEKKPIRHVDIGSRVDGFVSHVAVFREIEIFDIRPLESKTKNIIFKQADLMNLPIGFESCSDSVSSLHALEHFGLGRYGDPINYYGHISALENIYKMLKSGGTFYYSSPIGKQRIEFNAHRIFSINYLLKYFKGKYKIINFSYVNDSGDFFENIEINTKDADLNFNCKFGCGIFELEKI